MIDSHYFLIIVGLMCVGTILIRGFFIALSGKMVISPKVRELFTYIPASIIPALIIPSTFFQPGKERFLILLAASIVCYFVRNTFAVIAFGLVLLYLVTQL